MLKDLFLGQDRETVLITGLFYKNPAVYGVCINVSLLGISENIAFSLKISACFLSLPYTYKTFLEKPFYRFQSRGFNINA